jgi:tetratricopeptide (TPR) repeat protein
MPAPASDAPMDSLQRQPRGLGQVSSLGPDDDDAAAGETSQAYRPEPEHKETSQEDIEVGGYYLDTKNWKAALSRFESAMVLAPDEPEVYWGLAESERHLGNLAAARAITRKWPNTIPDSKHGKEAMKALKEPEIANAKALPPGQCVIAMAAVRARAHNALALWPAAQAHVEKAAEGQAQQAGEDRSQDANHARG